MTSCTKQLTGKNMQASVKPKYFLLPSRFPLNTWSSCPTAVEEAHLVRSWGETDCQARLCRSLGWMVWRSEVNLGHGGHGGYQKWICDFYLETHDFGVSNLEKSQTFYNDGKAKSVQHLFSFLCYGALGNQILSKLSFLAGYEHSPKDKGVWTAATQQRAPACLFLVIYTV